MSPCRNNSPHNGRRGTRIPSLENWQLTSSLLCPGRLDVLHVKSQNQISKGTHLARRPNCIPATRTKEAPLTRLPPIPGNNLGMEGQCCSWRCPSKPGKPQEQLVKDWRGRSARIPQPSKTEPAAPVTTIGYFHPQWRRVRGQICKRLPHLKTSGCWSSVRSCWAIFFCWMSQLWMKTKCDYTLGRVILRQLSGKDKWMLNYHGQRRVWRIAGGRAAVTWQAEIMPARLSHSTAAQASNASTTERHSQQAQLMVAGTESRHCKCDLLLLTVPTPGWI